MTDEEEVDENTSRVSKRDRLKGAFAKAKTKAKSRWKEDEYDDDGPGGLNAEVDDFLSASRTSTSSRPSFSDSLSFASDRPSTAESLLQQSPSRVSPSDRLPIHPPQPVPHPQRRLVVPRIDVSNSQRWPGANPVQFQDIRNNQLLRPESHSRSRSVSSLSKGTGRARGLSVTFMEAPPVIIGEGGDEAQAPPVEISRARARARSVSPLPTQPLLTEANVSGKISPIKRKPVPETTRPIHFEPFQPRIFRRTPTGLSTPPEQKRAMDKEFDMSLGLGSGTSTSKDTSRDIGHAPIHATILAPKPVHPPVTVPVVREVKAVHASNDLHGQFEEVKINRTVQPHVHPNSIPENQVYYPPPPEPGRHRPSVDSPQESIHPSSQGQNLTTQRQPDENWI